jgi:hypothetical protein
MPPFDDLFQLTVHLGNRDFTTVGAPFEREVVLEPGAGSIASWVRGGGMDSNCRLAGLRLAQPVDITLSNGRKGRFTPRLLDGRGTLGVLDFDTRSRGQETLASERGSTFRHAPPLPR